VLAIRCAGVYYYMTTGRRAFKAGGVLGMALLVSACDGGDRIPSATSPNAPAGVPTAASPRIGEPISGVVYDTAMRPVAGARVELLDGPQAGMSITADANGGFSLTATVDDTTQFRASKEGHVSASVTILPHCDRCNPKRWVFFYLDVLEPPVAVAGDYTLTFVAGSNCTSLPADLRTRSYGVTIGPADLNWHGYPGNSSTSFKVRPNGSSFPDGLNGFYLNVAGNYINLSLGDHTDPGITEQVEANTYFAFGGWAILSTAPPVSTISTTFQGWIDYCVNPNMGARYDCKPSPAVTLTRCESTTHQLILTRR
jgi:hypothetical protein